MIEISVLLDRVSKATGEMREEIVAKGVVEYLKSKLREVNAETIEICNRYRVASAEDMGKSMKVGSLRRKAAGVTFLG